MTVIGVPFPTYVFALSLIVSPELAELIEFWISANESPLTDILSVNILSVPFTSFANAKLRLKTMLKAK